MSFKEKSGSDYRKSSYHADPDPTIEKAPAADLDPTIEKAPAADPDPTIEKAPTTRIRIRLYRKSSCRGSGSEMWKP